MIKIHRVILLRKTNFERFFIKIHRVNPLKKPNFKWFWSKFIGFAPLKKFRLERLYQPQKSSLLFKFCLQTELFKSYLQLQSLRFILQIVQFQNFKNRWKVQTFEECWRNFAQLFRRVDFVIFFDKSVLARKMGKNERIFVLLSSSIGKMEANKIAESFQTYRILAFELRSLIAWLQPIKLRKREFDRLIKTRYFY